MPVHTLIEGDNLVVAESLERRGERFDLIYLDPPYDTGAPLTFADTFGSSEWVDFFRPRLRAAAGLLARPHGVVIIAIDDRRFVEARVVADEVLGRKNFVSTVVWDGGVKGQARLISTSHDYMLIYVADADWYRRERVTWRETKPGVDEVLAAAKRLWNGDPDVSSEAMKQWYRRLPVGHPAKTRSMVEYNKFDEGGRLFREGPVSRPTRQGYFYDVIHPVTGLAVAVPGHGWRYTQARMDALIAEGRISFRGDHTRTIATKLFLDELTTQVATSVFTQKRTRAARRLGELIGAGKFTFPKDVQVLARWFRLVTRDDPHIRVLDLFAGSGATAEAVMELNDSDGGRRESTLVNTNEVSGQVSKALLARGQGPGSAEWEAAGVFYNVLLPRVEMAAEQYGETVRVLPDQPAPRVGCVA